MRMQRSVFLLAIVALLVAGCVETKQAVTVNPDGSGKAIIDTIAAPPLQMEDQSKAAAKDPDTIARTTVEGILAGAKGVEAWSDLSYDITKEGRVHLHVVAYFPDLGKFSMEPVPQMKWDRATQTLQAVEKKSRKAATEPTPAATPAERQKQVMAARMQYQQGRPMMVAMLGGLKFDLTYALPGAIDQSSIFTKTNEGGVQVVFEGRKAIEGLDKLIMDDTAALDTVGGGKIDENPAAMYTAMFGSKGPLSAHVAGDLKPQFDYVAESKTAKDAQPAMLEKLQLKIKAPANALHMSTPEE